jgi:hypothetical protein
MSYIQPSATKPTFRGSSPFFLIDILCPLLAFQLLRHIFPEIPAAAVLAMSGIFPLLSCITRMIYSDHPDVLGLLVIGAILISSSAGFLGAREVMLFPITTGIIGLLFLLSLLFPRPIIFYIGRQLTTRNNPTWIADFNASWNVPAIQLALRLMTLIWGCGMTLEFVVQIIFSYALSASLFPLVSSLLKSGVFIGLIIWTVIYIRRHPQ